MEGLLGRDDNRFLKTKMSKNENTLDYAAKLQCLDPNKNNIFMGTYRDSSIVGMSTSDLDGGLVGFRSTVAEKDLVGVRVFT